MKYLILENIRSAYNVGAIFRTADGAGVSKIFLIGYTPAPTDRFGRSQPEIKKTSLGASETLPWEHHGTTLPVLENLRKAGVITVVVEQGRRSQWIGDFVVPKEVVYVVGNEIDGVSAAVQEAADMVIEIPMLGSKESLNVSVAAGIVLYHGLGRK